MDSCRLIGHRPRYRAAGTMMRWSCERDCGYEGAKEYSSADAARRYATALNREDQEGFGRRPLLSMLPLKLIERAARRAR